MIVFEISWYTQPTVMLFTVCLNLASFLCTGLMHCTFYPLSCTRPVLMTAVLQVTNSCHQSWWSSHGCLWTWLLSIKFYHVPHKCQFEVSVWNFRTTGIQEHMAVQRLRRWKNSFLLPFPCTVTDRIANGHSVTFVDVPHMSFVVHNGWVWVFSSLIT